LALAANHPIAVVLPDPRVLRNAVQAVTNCLSRIDWALADLRAVGLKVSDDAELSRLLANGR